MKSSWFQLNHSFNRAVDKALGFHTMLWPPRPSICPVLLLCCILINRWTNISSHLYRCPFRLFIHISKCEVHNCITQTSNFTATSVPISRVHTLAKKKDATGLKRPKSSGPKTKSENQVYNFYLFKFNMESSFHGLWFTLPRYITR